MWSHIKEILQNEKGKCIIVEDGKPTYILISVEEYLKLKENNRPSPANLVKTANFEGKQSLNNLENLINQSLEEKPKLTIDDLPF